MVDKNKRKHQRRHCNLPKQEELVEHFAQLANRLAGTSSTLLITDHILMDVIAQMTEVDTDRGKKERAYYSITKQTYLPALSLSFPLFLFRTHRWVREESKVRHHMHGATFWKNPHAFLHNKLST